METSTILHSQTSSATENEEHTQTPKTHPLIGLWPQKQFLFELDYAVREQIKRQLQRQLTREMDHFVSKGLTFDQLKEVQKELELCPSVLEFYPGKRNFLFIWWYKATSAIKNLFSHH